jgi:hypothetical protein
VATIDENDLVISSLTTADPDPGGVRARLAESEYARTSRTLRRSGATGVHRGKLSTARAGPARSPAAERWRPLGVDQELRLMFLADGACWGAAGLVRSGGDFTDGADYYRRLGHR